MLLIQKSYLNQPINNERWLGIQGQGSWFNGQKISTRNCKKINDAVLSSSSPYFFKDQNKIIFDEAKLASNAKPVRVGDILLPDVEEKYTISDKLFSGHKRRLTEHKAKGNGFGFEIIPDDGIANAVVCGGMGRERNLVLDNRITDFTPETKIKGVVNREGVRKMTPREWARLQGFPDNYVIPVADASAYKQFGNSVAVPAIQATANKILETIGIK